MTRLWQTVVPTSISGGGRVGIEKPESDPWLPPVPSVSFESRRRNKSYLGQLTQLKGSQPSARGTVTALNLLTSRHLSWNSPQPRGPSLPRGGFGWRWDVTSVTFWWPKKGRKLTGLCARLGEMKWPVHPARLASLPQGHWAQHATEFMNCEFLTAMGEAQAGRTRQNSLRRSGAKVRGWGSLLSTGCPKLDPGSFPQLQTGWASGLS